MRKTPPNDTSFASSAGALFYERIQSFINAGNQVLDFGCGGGILINKLMEAGIDCVGFDVAGHGDNPHIVKQPPDTTFDVVIASEVYEHLLTHELGASANSGLIDWRQGGAGS